MLAITSHGQTMLLVIVSVAILCGVPANRELQLVQCSVYIYTSSIVYISNHWCCDQCSQVSSYKWLYTVCYMMLYNQYDIPASLSDRWVHILPVILALLVHWFNGIQRSIRYVNCVIHLMFKCVIHWYHLMDSLSCFNVYTTVFAIVYWKL